MPAKPKDVYVHHPVFTNRIQKVAADKVKEWTDSGWVRVKRADEEKLNVSSA